MKKKIFVGVGIIVLLFVAYVGYLFATTRSHSPADVATFSKDGLDINVNYCRPYKKGRVIFGTEEAKALQPYGHYWRLGANDATEISFNKNVNFGGKSIAAGKYRMYAVPGKDKWEISLNSEVGKFGYSEPDYKLDVLKAEVAPAPAALTEQLTISFAPIDKGADMGIVWDDVKVIVPITAE